MKGLLLRIREKKRVREIRKVKEKVKLSIYIGVRETFHFNHCDSCQYRGAHAYRIEIDGMIAVGITHYLLGNRGVMIRFWVFSRLNETSEAAWS